MAKDVRAGGAFVEVMLRDKLGAGLAKAGQRMRAFAAGVASIGAGALATAGAIAAPLAVSVNQFAAVGDQLHKMAARTGVSGEALSELGHAANLSGSNVGQLGDALFRMRRRVANAASSTGPAVRALDELGLSAKSLSEQSPEDQFLSIVDALGGVENESRAAQLAFEIFGNSAKALLPLLQSGTAGIEEMRQHARDLGITLSDDDVDAAAALTDALGSMGEAVNAIKTKIGAALAPNVTNLADRFALAVGRINKFIDANRPLVVGVAAAAGVLGLLGGGLVALAGLVAVAGFALSGLGAVAGVVGSMFGALVGAVGLIASPLGLVVAGIGAAAAAFVYFSGIGAAVADTFARNWGDLLAFSERVFGGLANAVRAGDLELAARILWAALRALWQRGANELSALWATITARAAGAFDAIVARGQQFAAQVGGVVGSVVEWFANLATSARATAAGVVAGFAGLARFVGQTVGAMGSAIARGDLATAGALLWNALELAFVKGTATVAQIWGETWAGLATVVDGVITAVRSSWVSLTEFLAEGLLRLVGWAQDALAAVADIVPGLERVRETLEASSINVEATIAASREDADRKRDALAAAKEARDVERARRLQESLAASDERIARLEKARQELLAQNAGDGTPATAVDPMAELNALLAEAAKAAEVTAAEAGGAETPDLEETSRRMSDVVEGTTSASAAAILARGSVRDRALDAAETTAEEVTAIRKLMETGDAGGGGDFVWGA